MTWFVAPQAAPVPPQVVTFVDCVTLSPVAAFLKKYVLQQAFREGTHGFLLAALHALYTFVKYAKLWELQQQKPVTAPPSE